MSFYTNGSSDRGMIVAMQATFDKALNTTGYKGGAFRGLTNASTPPLDVLNILLASELVTEQEKAKAFRPWKQALLRFYNTNPAAVNPLQMIMLMMQCPEWCEVFEDDIRRRGRYVPPTTIQTLNDNGTVDETRTIGRNGNVQVTEGGRPSEVPGAPKHFNKAQGKNWENVGESADARVIIVMHADVDAEEEAGTATRDKSDATGVNEVSVVKKQEGSGSDAEKDGKQASLDTDLGDLMLQGLDKKGRREAAKAAKKAAKKLGKKTDASK